MENTNKRFLKNYPDVLTPKDLKEFLGFGKDKTYSLLKNGDIKCLKMGKKILIPKPYLRDFLLGAHFGAHLRLD